MTNEHPGVTIDNECFCDIPEIAGPSWWAILEGWANGINEAGCVHCGGFAIKFVSFFHDLVNVKLEKPLHDPKNFVEIAEAVQRLVEQSKQTKDGHVKLVVKAKPYKE